jgi:hypothetical protein
VLVLDEVYATLLVDIFYEKTSLLNHLYLEIESKIIDSPLVSTLRGWGKKVVEPLRSYEPVN